MADSSKDIQLHELKDMINDLKKMIKTLQATVDAANKREESLTQERDNLKEEIDLLRKKLFGTSSEKRTIDIPGQLNFFNEAELEQNPEAVKAEDLEALLPEKTAKKRKARATDAERFKGVPVEKKYLELSEEEKLCPSCGTPLKEIGEEFVRRELVFVPAKLKVYVPVNLDVDAEGNICPRLIRWIDGRVYEIDRLKHKCRAASTKVGGCGIRYTVMIGGHESFLFNEDEKWFVEAKEQCL